MLGCGVVYASESWVYASDFGEDGRDGMLFVFLRRFRALSASSFSALGLETLQAERERLSIRGDISATVISSGDEVG